MQETLLNVASSACDTRASDLFPFFVCQSLPESRSSNNHFGKLAMFRESITCVASSNRLSGHTRGRHFASCLSRVKVQAGGQTQGVQKIVKSFKTKDLHRQKPGRSPGWDQCRKKRNSHRH